MMDLNLLKHEPQDRIESSFSISEYDHKNISKDPALILNNAKIWEDDWKCYARDTIIKAVENELDQSGLSSNEQIKALVEMGVKIEKFKSSPPTKSINMSNRLNNYQENVYSIESRLKNAKIELYNKLFPDIVKKQRVEVLKKWFNPDSDRKDGEFYWGRFTIQAIEDSIDLRIPSEETVKMITDKIQSLFPAGISARVCTQIPGYETNTEQRNWNSYSKQERTFPVFISYIFE